MIKFFFVLLIFNVIVEVNNEIVLKFLIKEIVVWVKLLEIFDDRILFIY